MKVSTIIVQFLLLSPLVSAVAITGVQMAQARGGAISEDGDCPSEPDLGHDRLKHKSSGPTTNKYVERILQSQWELHRRWRKVAKIRRRNIEVGRVAKLVLVSTGAVAQVAATQLPVKYRSMASMFGGACVGVGATIKTRLLTDQAVTNMITSFATSEALKAEVFKFRAEVSPYGDFKTNPDGALKVLRERCQSISDSITDDKFDMMMPDKKAVPASMDTLDGYLEKRLDRQINHFYIKRGRKMMGRAKFCNYCENVLLTLGTVAGFGAKMTKVRQFLIPAVIQKVLIGMSGWGGAFTATSTAFANHLAKQKFTAIAQKYFDAADDLKGLKDSWPSTATKSGSPEWDKHVTKSEGVIRSTLGEWAKAASGNDKLELLTPKEFKKDISDMVWKPNVICGTDESGFFPASDRMQWLVDNQSMTPQDAQKKVMEEFPAKFQKT